MRRLLLTSATVATLLLAGCLLPGRMSVTSILLLSKFYDPSNYTVLEEDILGDGQDVMFYVEVRDFTTKKVGEAYEFWVSIDISIQDSGGRTFVSELNEKEIHTTNATEKPGMVWYTYAWFTGNIVKSDRFTVKIVAKDKLSNKVVEVERDFYVDLSRQPQ